MHTLQTAAMRMASVVSYNPIVTKNNSSETWYYRRHLLSKAARVGGPGRHVSNGYGRPATFTEWGIFLL